MKGARSFLLRPELYLGNAFVHLRYRFNLVKRRETIDLQ